MQVNSSIHTPPFNFSSSSTRLAPRSPFNECTVQYICASHPAAQQRVCCHSNCRGAQSSAACFVQWMSLLATTNHKLLFFFFFLCRGSVKMEGLSGWALAIMYLPSNRTRASSLLLLLDVDWWSHLHFAII